VRVRRPGGRDRRAGGRWRPGVGDVRVLGDLVARHEGVLAVFEDLAGPPAKFGGVPRSEPRATDEIGW
jgi:hypothetical protein